MTTTLPRPGDRRRQLADLDQLAAIPEEEIWLASQKSARTRRAYRLDVARFMRTLGITTPEQLRQVDHRAVIAWECIMREEQGAAFTVRRRLAALSSLFKHLVRKGRELKKMEMRPATDSSKVTSPAINISLWACGTSQAHPGKCRIPGRELVIRISLPALTLSISRLLKKSRVWF